MATVLVIEDDVEINALVSLHIKKNGHQVVTKLNGIELEDESLNEIDLIILDVMLPVINGFQLIPIIRRKTNVPIVMLTAMNREEDIVRGFDLGADDYVCKPFGIPELMSRINAHLRRYETFMGDAAQLLTNGNLTLDVHQYILTKDEHPIVLNPIEFKMMKYFLEHVGQIISKKDLYEHAWENDYQNDDNTIMVHIRRLRAKIEDDSSFPTRLITIPRVGYRLERR